MVAALQNDAVGYVLQVSLGRLRGKRNQLADVVQHRQRPYVRLLGRTFANVLAGVIRVLGSDRAFLGLPLPVFLTVLVVLSALGLRILWLGVFVIIPGRRIRVGK